MSDSVPTGTSPALEGYFYQLDVSIFIALELVMSQQVAPSVVLEPASREDLETDIAEEPQILAESAQLESYRLVVQCKMKNTGPWKVGDLAVLLKHGKRRVSAAKRLADMATRYLLVTNADVVGVARNMLSTELGYWPNLKLPKEVAATLTTNARGRVAVLAVLNAETITSRLRQRLIERFRVPHAHFDACVRDLREEALLRMRGAAGGVWARADIKQIIVKHGGYAGRADALVGFVPPKNWAEMRQILSTHHAILLTGPSGTGKTRTAKALIASLRDELKGIAVCEVRGGPEKMREEKRRPVVFDIEDPWGRFQLEPGAIEWNGSIHSLLQNAGPDRKYVITNRSDVLEESGLKAVPGKFVVRLEAHQYGREERARLFRFCLETLPAGLKTRVVAHWRQRLPDLETPLEMERYFVALAGGPHEGEHEQEYFRRCLNDAHQHSIEQSILLNVKSRDHYRWAAVLWGLFKSNPTQTFKTLPMIQAALTQKDLAFEDGLMPYVNFMVAGHNLRQLGPELSYQHPRVELGLQQAMQCKPGMSARALLSLTQILVEFGKTGQLEWGREGAAQLIAATTRIEGLQVSLRDLEQAELDDWLYTRLASPGLRFQDDLKLAATVGSSQSVVAELARWLIHRADDDFIAFDIWRAKNDVTPAWIERVRADPATGTICAAFVRRMLARDCGFYREDFVHEIRKLAPNVGHAFRDAAMDNADYGYSSNANTIAYGALEDLDAFEPVLTKCLEHLVQIRTRGFDDDWLALHDGHYDDEAAEHYEQSRGEEGHTAYQFVAAYVSARRERTGWQSLRDHPRCGDLLTEWIRAAGRDSSSSDEEWRALAARAVHTEAESYFWTEAASHWSASLADVSRARLVEGGADDSARVELAEILARHLVGETADIVRALLAKGTERVLQLACDLASAKLEASESAVLASAIERIAASLPAPIHDALREAAALVPIATARPSTLPVWRSLNTGGSRRLRLARARVLALGGDDITGELKELLKPLRDCDEEVEFAKATLAVAIQAERWEVVEGGLAHRFADVRERAMEALSERVPGALPAAILELSGDKSHKVRGALLKLMKRRRHPDHTDTLVQLASDTWTPDIRWEGYRLRFPIAEGAAEVLSSPPLLDEGQGEQILAIALKQESEGIAGALLRALVANGTAKGRAAVVTAALQSDSIAFRRLSAQALVANANKLDNSSFAQVRNEHLAKGPARAAYALSILVGLRADVDQVVSAATAVAAVPERRALLIPLYLTLRDRDIEASKAILGLLPSPLASKLARAVDEGSKLPNDALAPLNVGLVGEILVKELVNHLDLLKDSATVQTPS